MVDGKNDHLVNIFFSYCNNSSDLRLVLSWQFFFEDISEESFIQPRVKVFCSIFS